MDGPTVGGHGDAIVDSPPIGAAAFAAWLDSLTPAQHRSVIAVALVDGILERFPQAEQREGLELLPTAAALAAQAQVRSQAVGVEPVLVNLAGVGIYYTAGGPVYRALSSMATFEELGLNAAAIVRVEKLGLPTGAPIPTGSTPASLFAEVGRRVAGSGDVGAAVALARFAVHYLGVAA